MITAAFLAERKSTRATAARNETFTKQKSRTLEMTDEAKPSGSTPSEPEDTSPASQFHKVEAEYTAEDLQHLSDLEHVRERPSMYIGDTTLRGLHHMVYEVVDNSIDEAMAGYAHQVSVTINSDSSVTVEDDGRGIPVEEHTGPGLLHAAGRDDGAQVRRQVSEGGLPDVRRFARRRRHGGKLSLRVVRSRGAPRRPRLPAGVRAGHSGGRRAPHGHHRQGGHQDDLQARPARSSPTPSSSTTRCIAACRSWRFSIAA